MNSTTPTTTTRAKIVVTRDLGPDVMPLLERPDIEVVVWREDRACERDWLLANVPGAAGIVVMLADKVDVELVDTAGPNLRAVSTMSVGYEHADLAALRQRGIRLGYTPDVLTDAVADICVMLALMAGRNAGATMAVVRNGDWPRTPWSPFVFCGTQLGATPQRPTRTAGFLGFGRIAQATLTRLVAFGITHCIYTGNPASPADAAADAQTAARHGLRGVARVGLDALARESDVLFVLAPGGAGTLHMVDAAFLRKMKRTSVLVNAARGSVVDSDALALALQEGWIWGAGLDVVEGEPNIRPGHPLLAQPRCVVVPHIGSATFETRTEMGTLAVRNVLAGVRGEEMLAELDLGA